MLALEEATLKVKHQGVGSTSLCDVTGRDREFGSSTQAFHIELFCLVLGVDYQGDFKVNLSNQSLRRFITRIGLIAYLDSELLLLSRLIADGEGGYVGRISLVTDDLRLSYGSLLLSFILSFQLIERKH